ncbi:DUF7064 domain-containing protein [Aeromicrobium ginsengisoli]|uniref:DUF7065 domain-containing protein n=1 Tax=Aeromicrobium ginsengisoli TaxID=363867 RepID=UPI00165FE633|nr:hypothetical protein [Aeromicrobium ginsengisoli]
MTVFRTAFDESDLHSHVADEGDQMWQESFCIVWHDPITQSGGNHHFSLWRNQGIADIWSWVVVEGKEVAREQVHDIPIPDEDYADTTVGGMHAICGNDFQHYTLVHTFEGCTVTIRYSAYLPPVELDYASGGASLGKRHFETLGTVEVTVELGDRVLDLTGVAFHDHSWGHRELERNPAGQWMFGVFGPDLMASVYLRQTVDGPSQDGWVYDHGDLKRVQSASVQATIAGDGLYPRRAIFDVWTEGGGHRFTGELQAGAVEGGIGLLAGDGLMTFECGGRLGGGLVELKPLRFALPEHRAVLRLPD